MGEKFNTVNIENEISLLETGFQNALTINASGESIRQLLAFFGEQLNADRFYLYKKVKRGIYENAEEWCREGVDSEKEYIAQLSNEVVMGLIQLFQELKGTPIRSLEEAKSIDQNAYEILKLRGANTILMDDIIYHGEVIGFYGIENVPNEKLAEAQDVLSVNRYLFAEILHSQLLEEQLEKIGYRDPLTGIGNRSAMYANEAAQEVIRSVGVYFVDLLDLKSYNAAHGESGGDRLLIKVAQLFSACFGNDNVYRVGGDEFVAVTYDLSEFQFLNCIKQIEKTFKDEKIQFSSGEIYRDHWEGDIDELIRRADLKVFDAKRLAYRATGHDELSASNEQGVQLIESITELDFTNDTYKSLYRKKNTFNSLPDEGSLTDGLLILQDKYVHPDDREIYYNVLNSDIKEKINAQPNKELWVEYRACNNEGNWEWMHETFSLVDTDHHEVKVISTIKNISALHEEVSLLDREGDNSGGGTAHLDFPRGEDALHNCDNWLKRTPAREIAMIAVDLNNFKLYNSIFGREAGDSLLKVVGDMLQRVVAEQGGVVGYDNGDNFMLLTSCDGATQDDIRAWAEKKIADLDLPSGFVPAFGVNVTTDKSIPASVLYERALLIVGDVKNNYTNHVAFYDENNYLKSQQSQILLMDIEKGLKENEFIFHLQPKVNIRTEKVVSFEALVRWQKGDELVSPAVFVDLMEETGYIHALDIHVWEEVCKFQRSLMDEGIKPLPISVNVSRIDFHFGDVAKTIIEMVDRYALPHDLIQIEVTESAYARDPEIIRKNVRELHENGFMILMDDFGKGYSSLNSLRGMYVDVLKLDKKFIDGMEANETDRQIVESVVRMAHVMGLTVIVEGVETRDQARELANMHCRYAQGFCFYKPMSCQDARTILLNEKRLERLAPVQETRRIDPIHFDEFIDAKMITVDQLNHMIGALGIVSIKDGKLEMLQMNQQASDLFGIPSEEGFVRKMVMAELERRMSENISDFEEATKYPEKGITGKGRYGRVGDDNEMIATIFPLKSDVVEDLYLLWWRKP